MTKSQDCEQQTLQNKLKIQILLTNITGQYSLSSHSYSQLVCPVLVGMWIWQISPISSISSPARYHQNKISSKSSISSPATMVLQNTLSWIKSSENRAKLMCSDGSKVNSKQFLCQNLILFQCSPAFKSVAFGWLAPAPAVATQEKVRSIIQCVGPCGSSSSIQLACWHFTSSLAGSPVWLQMKLCCCTVMPLISFQRNPVADTEHTAQVSFIFLPGIFRNFCCQHGKEEPRLTGELFFVCLFLSLFRNFQQNFALEFF